MYSHICITTKIEATNLKENKGYMGGCIERKRKREIIYL